MSRMTCFALQRAFAMLDGYKYGTKAADWSPLVFLVEGAVRWVNGGW